QSVQAWSAMLSAAFPIDDPRYLAPCLPRVSRVEQYVAPPVVTMRQDGFTAASLPRLQSHEHRLQGGPHLRPALRQLWELIEDQVVIGAFRRLARRWTEREQWSQCAIDGFEQSFVRCIPKVLCSPTLARLD